MGLITITIAGNVGIGKSAVALSVIDALRRQGLEVEWPDENGESGDAASLEHKPKIFVIESVGQPKPLTRLDASQIRHLSHKWANAAALAAACSPMRWREKKQRAKRRDAERDRLQTFVKSLTQAVQG